MTNNKSFIWVPAIIAVTLFSCKKDTGTVGLNVGDNNIGMEHLDTFGIISQTVREDSLQTHNLSFNILGASNSSTYGKSFASVYFNLSLPRSNFSFGQNYNIDSVVVSLEYSGPNGFNGDLSDALAFDVYEMTERIYGDRIYYSNDSFDLDPTKSGSYTGGINPKDSVEIKGSKLAPHLRIKLDNQFVDKFQFATDGNFVSNESLQNFLNGLYLTANPALPGTEMGLFAHLQMNEGISGLTVYYNDTSSAFFPVGANGVSINRFRHDFSSSKVLNQLNTAGDSTYILSLAGLKTFIEVPGISELAKNSDAVLANAYFEFSHFDNQPPDEEFKPFTRLLLLSKGADGKNDFLIDVLNEPNLYGGGLSDGKYRFNVTRHIQYIITHYQKTGEDLNRGFFLIAPTDNPITASRLMMDMSKTNFRISLVKTN